MMPEDMLRAELADAQRMGGPVALSHAQVTFTLAELTALREALRSSLLEPVGEPVAEKREWQRLIRGLREAIARARQELRDVDEPVAQRIADILWGIPTATIEEVDGDE